MKIHQEKVKKAIENIKKYLTENKIEYLDYQKGLTPSVDLHYRDNGIILQTNTTLFEEFRAKYVYVTPEQVALIGKNVPYNYTNWVTLKSKTYSSKSEMLKLIQEYMYNSAIDVIWLND